MRRALVSAGLGLLSALALSSVAVADVGPVDKSCTAERRCVEGGVECRYVNSDPSMGDVGCEERAEESGLEYVCTRGGGTVGSKIYCPKGKVRKSSCAVDPDAEATALLGAIFLLGVASYRRRR